MNGVISLLGAALFYSVVGVLIRSLDSAFGVYTQVGVRALALVLMVLVWLVLTARKVKLSRETLPLLIGMTLCAYVSTVLFTRSVVMIQASNALFFLYGSGYITALILGVYVFGERFGGLKLTGTIFALMGLSMVAGLSLPVNVSAGMLAALGGGVFFGLTNMFRKRLGNYDRISVLLFDGVLGSMLMFGAAIFTQEVMFKQVTILVMLLVGVFALGNLLSGWATLYGFTQVNLQLGTVILTTDVLFAMGMNALFLGERPTGMEALGGLMIFVAIIMLSMTAKILKIDKRKAVYAT